MAKATKSVASKKTAVSTSAKPKKVSQGLAIAALILNILVIPGLGTIIGGRTKTGILQMVFFVLGMGLVVGGAIFSIFLVGIPFLIAGLILVFAMWVWAIVTGVQLIKESQ